MAVPMLFPRGLRPVDLGGDFCRLSMLRKVKVADFAGEALLARIEGVDDERHQLVAPGDCLPISFCEEPAEGLRY